MAGWDKVVEAAAAPGILAEEVGCYIAEGGTAGFLGRLDSSVEVLPEEHTGLGAAGCIDSAEAAQEERTGLAEAALEAGIGLEGTVLAVAARMAADRPDIDPGYGVGQPDREVAGCNPDSSLEVVGRPARDPSCWICRYL